MKDAFEKIKERLRTEKSELTSWAEDMAFELGIDKAIEIVNQVAEEYVPDINVGNNDGWIPCSERLPECEDYEETDALLFQLRSGTIEVGYFGRNNAWRDTYFRNYRNVAGVDASNVIAWQPLPKPYELERRTSNEN